MKPSKSRLGQIISLVFICLLVAGGILAFVHRFWIYDQAMIWQHPPTAAARQLVTDTGMTEPAAMMFYGARADLNTSDEFKQHCSGEEATIVLGCYASGQIYVLNVNDARIKEVEEVTAAHEMLHVAYERLSEGERQKLDGLLEDAYQTVKDQRLETLMEAYAKSEPTEHYNELHSILGTEYNNLGTELEKHYERFFNDRQCITAMAHSYQAVFTSLKEQQQTLIQQLQDLAQRIDQQTQSYNDELAAFNADVADFNIRASAGNGSFTELNRERNQLIAQQNRLENLRENIVAQRNEYEAKRHEYNQLVLTSESLQSSLKGLVDQAESL